jgi:hypothetical protein
MIPLPNIKYAEIRAPRTLLFRVLEMNSSILPLEVEHVSEQTSLPLPERTAHALQSAMPQ